MSRFTCLPGYTFCRNLFCSQRKCRIFRVFLVQSCINRHMVGLIINPVCGLISQQPGPIKMRQVTRCHWSYIRNYNRIHYLVFIHFSDTIGCGKISDSPDILYMRSFSSLIKFAGYNHPKVSCTYNRKYSL